MKRSQGEILEYLRDRYADIDFNDLYEGYSSIDDYLDIDRVISEIRQEIEKREQIKGMEQSIEIHKRERDLVDKFREKETNPERKKKLDEQAQQYDKTIKDKKKELKTATKTKLTWSMAEMRRTDTPVRRKEALVKRETALTRKTKKKMADEQRAAEQIRKAREEIAERKR